MDNNFSIKLIEYENYEKGFSKKEEIYVLFFNSTPISRYYVYYHARHNARKYTDAEIWYENLHCQDQNFLNKGYTSFGLNELLKHLIELDYCPAYFYLSINEDHYASQRVAKKAGFINNIYFHPNTNEMYRSIMSEALKNDPEQLASELLKFEHNYNLFKQGQDKYLLTKK